MKVAKAAVGVATFSAEAPTEVGAGAMGEYTGHGRIPPEMYPPSQRN